MTRCDDIITSSLLSKSIAFKWNAMQNSRLKNYNYNIYLGEKLVGLLSRLFELSDGGFFINSNHFTSIEFILNFFVACHKTCQPKTIRLGAKKLLKQKTLSTNLTCLIEQKGIGPQLKDQQITTLYETTESLHKFNPRYFPANFKNLVNHWTINKALTSGRTSKLFFLFYLIYLSFVKIPSKHVFFLSKATWKIAQGSRTSIFS